MSDLDWEELRLPVDIAFFFRRGRGRVDRAFYPSPMGPTESLLARRVGGARGATRAATLEPDVEALLVNRARGAREHWLVPIDDCYGLVGLDPHALARAHRRARGLGGDRRFFDGRSSASEDGEWTTLKVGKAASAADAHGARAPASSRATRRATTRRRSGHLPDGRSTAERSTGINAKAREPIDPRMPNLSPA